VQTNYTQAKTMTEQDFQTIDVEASAVQVQSAVQVAVQTVQGCSDESANSEVCSPSITLSPTEVAKEIGASLRSVYGYANKLLEIWSWMPESEFRIEGRYTPKALEEMKKLKAAKNASEYAASVTKETGNYTQKGGQLARVEATHSTSVLAAKPLPEFDVLNISETDTSAIRQRTSKLKEMDDIAANILIEHIGKKAKSKMDEIDAELDDFAAELKLLGKKQMIDEAKRRNS
jgi:hypothetical protein